MVEASQLSQRQLPDGGGSSRGTWEEHHQTQHYLSNHQGCRCEEEESKWKKNCCWQHSAEVTTIVMITMTAEPTATAMWLLEEICKCLLITTVVAELPCYWLASHLLRMRLWWVLAAVSLSAAEGEVDCSVSESKGELLSNLECNVV